MPSVYLGTGGYEGGVDLRGMLKPILFGYCLKINPICLDPVLKLYQVNDGPIYDILAVYDNGYPLMQLLDCHDLLNWKPSKLDITAEGYRVDPSRGIFRLACKPLGLVLVDCIGSTSESPNGLVEGYYMA